MIRLNLNPAAEWLDLPHDVRAKVAPLNSAIISAARTDPRLAGLDGATDAERGLAVSYAIARLAILEWENVGDEDGEPVEVTPEGIDALMDIPAIYDAFNMLYVAKGMRLVTEKNG